MNSPSPVGEEGWRRIEATGVYVRDTLLPELERVTAARNHAAVWCVLDKISSRCAAVAESEIVGSIMAKWKALGR